ncbi:MAG: DUF58 domain-containing protein [Bacteriovoracaceae bacterium]|nr:DUF58 domain-containing protein [Bacteriovoracaceae bacterium]
MDLTEVRKVVSRIKATLFKNSNNYSIGMLKSHFRGSGLQFKEHQVYALGDEVRFIDWKLLAKTATPYIKTFEEERNVEITVVIDGSPTMYNGVDGTSKLQAALELTCLLYILARETSDQVHVLFIADKVINIPSKSGEEGIAIFISTLVKNGILDSEGKIIIKQDFPEMLEDKKKMGQVLKHMGRQRELVVLSDFNDFLDKESLHRVMFQKKIHLFKLISPLDEAQSLPFLLYSKESPGKSKGAHRVFNLKRSDEELTTNKRIKNLRIENRYLEEFIKEML